MSHHLFASTWSIEHWLLQAGWLLAGLVGLSLTSSGDSRKLLFSLIVALCAWAVVAGQLLGAQLGLALGLQLEPWQAFRFVTILCAMSAAAGITRLQSRSLPSWLTRGLLCLAVLLSLLIGGTQHRRFLPLGEQGEINELGEAILRHVPAGKRLATPPVGLESLRWRSLRPQTLTWKDGGESLFDRSFALQWRQEMERSCACDPFPVDSKGGNNNAHLSALRAQLLSGYTRRTAKSLIDGARNSGASFIVAPTGLDNTGLTLIFRQPTWSLYSAAL